MDKVIPGLYREYGKFINSSRAFPLDTDGLKPVERKILLSTYLIARDKLVKSARVDGHVIGNFHPHSSVYSTIVQLVNQGFLDGQGNFGTNVGVEPVDAAASRYTEVRLSKNIKELVFKLVDYVPWEVNELQQKEPVYLPTMFPLCLTMKEYAQGIGFGYRTIIPTFKVEDLKKRLLFLLGKTTEKPTIKPISDCQITSSTQDLEKLLTTGKAAIEFKGTMKVEPLHSKIVVKSWPDGKKFETILSKISKELENGDIGFTDLSTTETMIVFEVLKQRNREEILKRTAKKLEDALKGSVSFEIIVTDEDKNVKNISVDQMLMTTYQMFKHTNSVMLTAEIKKLDDSITEMQILKKIRPSLAKHLKEKNIQAVPIDDIIKAVNEETKVPEEIIKQIIQKYNIKKLFTIDTDISGLEDQKKLLQDSIKNIDDFVLFQYSRIGG